MATRPRPKADRDRTESWRVLPGLATPGLPIIFSEDATMRAHLTLVLSLTAAGLAGCQTLGGVIDDAFGPDLRTEMAESDVDVAVATMQAALESASDGTETLWLNPETGNRGSFTPTHTFQTDGGFYCRDFTEALSVGAQTSAYESQACRTDDGVWALVQS